MKSVFLVAASTAIADSQTNSLSLIEIVEAFEVPQLPILIPRLAVVWLVARNESEPESAECEVQLILGGKTTTFPTKIDFKGQLRHRMVLQLQGLVLSEPGQVEIKITKFENSRRLVLGTLALPIVLPSGLSPSVTPSLGQLRNTSAQIKSATTKRGSRTLK